MISEDPVENRSPGAEQVGNREQLSDLGPAFRLYRERYIANGGPMPGGTNGFGSNSLRSESTGLDRAVPLPLVSS
jgi:hypothetical protein